MEPTAFADHDTYRAAIDTLVVRAALLRPATPGWEAADVLALEVDRGQLRAAVYDEFDQEDAAAALTATGVDAPELAAEVALLQGQTFRTAGGLKEARKAVNRAADLARHHGFTDILGRAGLEAAAAKTAGIGFEFGVVDEQLARLLEEALAVETDIARRVQLLSTLAITRYYDPDPGPCHQFAAEAIVLAESTGDERLLAAALIARATVLWTAAGLPERARTLDQAVLLAERSGDLDLEVRARVGLINSRLELGRLDDGVAEIERLDRLVERIGQPGYRFFPGSNRVLIDLLRGNYAKAAEGTEAVQALTHTLYGVNARLVYEARRFALASDLVGLVAGGDPDGRRRYEEVIDDLLVDDALWLPSMASKCELVRMFSDGPRARQLLEALRPYTGRLVCNATSMSTGGLCRYLGIVAHTCGELDEADGWFVRAAAEHEGWAARPWLARTFADHSELMRDRGGPGDGAEADALAELALEVAAEIGLHTPFMPRRG